MSVKLLQQIAMFLRPWNGALDRVLIKKDEHKFNAINALI